MCREGHVLKARRGFGRSLQGEAMVSPTPLHLVRDFDGTTGAIISPDNCLFGQSIAGKILVTPGTSGGTAGAFGIMRLKDNNAAPKAILFNIADPGVISGFILANVTVMDGFDNPPEKWIKTGEILRVYPKKRTVRVLEARMNTSVRSE